ncbi:MAG TPA: alpha/beta hydrolase [Candidatus Dormibacteraeota bacterium]|nr:alpha/beta hydrolase [Candidatus Dormibacteraeota bacterium]
MGAATTYRSHKLQVPGASLYYEVRGSGPVLLMMPGGPADATTFRQIENDLASRYTVVTYDPRGLSHSKLEGALDDARMVQIFADDVHRLLAKLTDGKARVFASSGGAVIALELAVRHPEQLEMVIAHEPPSPSLVPNSAKVRAAMEDVSDTHTKEGLWPAMNKFMVLVGIEGGPPPASEGEPAPEQLQAMAQMQRNMDFFFGRYIRNIARYQPDFAALKSCPCRIAAAVGEESGGQLAHEGGLGLATRLGMDAIVFPGDHGGFTGRPVEFSAKLLQVLKG